jgi:hypothetical protein
MELVSLTYTSRASPGLQSSDIDSIHHSALTYNPLDGITGLLVYNGEGFLQIIEGGESAIDDLAKRIAADPRHTDFEVRDRRTLAKRFFPNWTMFRIDIDDNHASGMARVEDEVGGRLDEPMLEIVSKSLGEISRAD